MFFRVWIFFFFHLRHDYYCWKPVLGGEDEFLFLRALQRGLSHCVRNRIPRAGPRDRLGPRPKSLSGCSLETVRPCSFKGFVSAFPACFWSCLSWLWMHISYNPPRGPNTLMPGSVLKGLVWRAVRCWHWWWKHPWWLWCVVRAAGRSHGLINLLPLWSLFSLACLPFPRPDSCGPGASAHVWRAFTRKVRDCAFGLWDGMGKGEEDFYETHRVRRVYQWILSLCN